MSAYLVTDFHINALVSWAATRHGSHAVSYYWNGRRRDLRNDEKRVASVLFAQNVRSVNSRYNEADPAHGFVFRLVVNVLNPIDVIKGCHGYAYQACETADWEETEAHAIIKAIEGAAVRTLPGYAESPAWCISERDRAHVARA
jgi:hypothetical protein